MNSEQSSLSQKLIIKVDKNIIQIKQEQHLCLWSGENAMNIGNHML